MSIFLPFEFFPKLQKIDNFGKNSNAFIVQLMCEKKCDKLDCITKILFQMRSINSTNLFQIRSISNCIFVLKSEHIQQNIY